MNRRRYCCALALLLGSAIPVACRGQQPSEDPATRAAVDSIMPRLEVLAGLKRVKPVITEQQDRAQLRGYVEQRLAEELPTAELEGIRQTYVALGLVPDTMDIKTLLLDLYTEQVAGYYDPKTDKLYLVAGTPVDMLRPVLVHELVHALQDQHTNLDSLISRKRGNDRQTAAQAAIEGHATLVMFAYLADQASQGQFDPGMLPDLGEQLRPSLEAQNEQFPVFRRAPRIIRETILFPYLGGAGFVQQLWRARGNQQQRFPAPIGVHLPQSTEQVMHPQSHFLRQRDEPTEVRFTSESAGKLLYENSIGELELSIWFVEHLGAGNEQLARGWDGDRYRLMEMNGKRVLLWQTVWDDAAAADRFADAYNRVARNRTGRAVRVQRNQLQGREGVFVVDAESGVNVNALPLPAVRIQ